MVLVDNGVTHNFIDEGLAAKRGLEKEDFERFKLMVVDGFTIPYTNKILYLIIILDSHKLSDNFYVVGIEETNVILGVEWLHYLREFTQSC